MRNNINVLGKIETRVIRSFRTRNTETARDGGGRGGGVREEIYGNERSINH